MIKTKVCTKCKVEKNIIFFGNMKNGKNGLRSICKECSYNKDNKRAYYQANKLLISTKIREYEINNKEKIREYKKKYHIANKIKHAMKNREYRQTLKYKIIDKNKQHSRRAKLKKGDVTAQELLELQQKAKVCYWCNVPLKNLNVHIDHYIPLSKGGEHTLSNLVISCSKCNQSKKAKDPIVFANSMGKLL